MKGRPRLVPKENYRASGDVNPWLDEKESDITSVSSASSEGFEDSEEETMASEEMEDTHGIDEDTDDEEEDEDEDEDEENESTMEQTLEPSPTEQSGKDEVTPLYIAIKGEEWDSVLAFLETGSWGWKWSSLCAQLYQVNEKPVDAQIRTWVTMARADGKTQLTRLPLHEAVARNAPYKIIEALVMSFSKGARDPDSEGNYPLHLAFQQASGLQTLTFLAKEYPEAVNLKNEEGKTPAECGKAKGISELVQICIDATKARVESELTKEKGNLEEDRKQLLEVTKELMNLKKIVAERERNMTKENFLYQKQHLSSAISQLTKLKLDLDKHEDSVLQHHLVAEKKRMDGVLGELQKTKGELAMIKSEKKSEKRIPNSGTLSISDPVGTSPVASMEQLSPKEKKEKEQSAKKKKSKKVKKSSTPKAEEVAPHAVVEPEPTERDAINVLEKTTSASPRDAPSDVWSAQPSSLTVGTDQPYAVEDGDGQDTSLLSSPATSTKGGIPGQPPKKMKNVAARFKKKMNWRKAEKQSAADNE